LKSYFAGERKRLMLRCVGRTEFQKKVWTALQDIPYGETVSYKELAKELAAPGGKSCGRRKWGESDSDYHSVPSRDRE